ncbi:MAG: hypothetical protein ACFNLK_05140 [Scardovia wiggsiae]|uniref:hypothetical protein n=1 Tax=Scardovia wiggsiae TaxID=230143 RepID=UPI0012DD7B63|nr:hypothetical protein [Scardovia wiggsiae]
MEIAENRENQVCICVFYHQKARKQTTEVQKYGEGSWPAPLWTIGRQEPAWDYIFAEA